MPPPLDLCKATKLREVAFVWTALDVRWITTVLQTAKSNNLQKINITFGVKFINPVNGTIRRAWQDLDRLLIELWASRSIYPTIQFRHRSRNSKRFTSSVFPELTRRGLVIT
jgi:hypothetical protein